MFIDRASASTAEAATWSKTREFAEQMHQGETWIKITEQPPSRVRQDSRTLPASFPHHSSRLSCSVV
jgi:hypothetical protein